MNLDKRRIAGFLALGLLVGSCGGSTSADPASVTKVEEPTPTTENLAAGLPGDGEILYQSQDAMCSQLVDGELLEDLTACPEGATDYWFLSDNTFVIDITEFDDGDEVELYHSATLGGRITWTKNDTATDDTDWSSDFFNVDGNYLIANIDPCLFASKIPQGEAPTPAEYRYNDLQVRVVYEYASVTIRSNGVVLDTEKPSLYHTIATNPALNRPRSQQGNQKLYDHVRDEAERCDPELDLTGPTYIPEPDVDRRGRPEK